MSTKPKSRPPRFVSGPARSRRFGTALNINFGKAGESCLWHCIYCPWHDAKAAKPGKSASLSHAHQAILDQLQAALKKNPKIDTIILGGNSEPTIYPEFPALVAGILKLRKSLRGKWAVVALSNGSGLTDKAVRSACDELDRIWIKLDCAEDPLFKQVHKPAKSAKANLKSHLEAIRHLSSMGLLTTLWKYPGKSSYQNWSAENLLALLDLYEKIKPAAIHLTTLKRDKRLSGARPVSWDEMESFALRVAELGIPVEVFP